MLKRRQVLTLGAGVAATAFGARVSHAQQTLLPAACTSPSAPILGWNNIPEYMWGAPWRTSFIENGMTGQRITLHGRVLTPRCEPIANARLEFWHTDAEGKYDYTGFKFRGSMNADDKGQYRLETLMPGRYSGRRHVHYLVGVRLGANRAASITAAAIQLPTDEELQIREAHLSPEVVSPTTITTENGVLMIPYDFVINVA